MNWKSVLLLISIDVKSGRLVRGQGFRRYYESKLLRYASYGAACFLGVAIGWTIGSFYKAMTDPGMRGAFHLGAISLFLSLPTLVLAYSLIFTMMGQIQRAGMKASIQPPYWLPITWEEHTLASTLANLLGIPLASIIFVGSGIVVASAFLGEMPLAIFTIFSLLASAFMASTITEVFRILQVRLLGAVYRSSGRAAVWVRFLGSMLFLIAFYMVWFAFTSGPGSITVMQMLSNAQCAVWFIPFVWLGMALSSFVNRLPIETLIYSAASLLFILTLFYMAVKLNSRFGLYEPPAITISRGVYAPKISFLGKVGFSSIEAAIIKKDFKAFTRRRELMYIFIMPLVFIIMPLMQFLGAGGQPPQTYPFMFVWIFLMPGAILAVTMGQIIIGEEGESVWRIYSSPITARSLVKCKYAFVTIISCMITAVCSVLGIALIHTSLDIAIATLIESMILVFALGMFSLGAGIRGADFVEHPRPRMVRVDVAFINIILCFLLALAILSPLIPYAMMRMGLPIPLPEIYLYIALIVSGVIASITTYIFYKTAVRNAEEFLIKAEG